MKTKKTKEAVSLIVLVLTIVIMIILAGVIVINLNNSGMIDRAKNAVSETNLKNMQELANVAWGEAYLSIEGEKTPELLKSTMLEKLKGKGVSEEELGKYTFDVTTGGVEVAVNTGSNIPEQGGTETPEPEEPQINVALNPSGTIPEGASYYRCNNPEIDPDYEEIDPEGDSAVYLECKDETLNAGDEFPDTPQQGDIYLYNGYKYIYEGFYDVSYSETSWWDGYDNGWGVVHIDYYKAEPNEILETINGKPILSMRTTFMGSDIVTAPAIPETVVDMYRTFNICYSLSTAPTIPSDVDNMDGTFFACSSLTGAITINSTPTIYDSCLSGTQITQILGDCKIKDEILATVEE